MRSKETDAAELRVGPANAAVHWNQQYYDNMAFHFWEPHHIGRTRNSESRIRTEADATAKLRGLEVVLNHQMELFFRRAPNDFIQGHFVSTFGADLADTYRVIGQAKASERFVARDAQGKRGLVLEQGVSGHYSVRDARGAAHWHRLQTN